MRACPGTRTSLLTWLLVVPSLALAAGEPLTPEQQRRLESKLALLSQMLEKSPATQRILTTPDDSEARQVLESVIARRAEAKQAMQSGLVAESEALLDEALAGFQNAARLAVDPGQQARVEEERYTALRKQATSFLEAFQRIVEEKGEGATRFLDTDDVALQLERADALAANESHSAANALMRGVNGQLEKALSDVRDRETLIQTLAFETPMDEYVYERERNLSHAMLIRLVAGEKALPSSSMNFIEALIERNRNTRQAAEQHVAESDVEAAISVLEQGTAELEKALRMVGVGF